MPAGVLYRPSSGALQIQKVAPAYDQGQMRSDPISSLPERSSAKRHVRLTPDRIKQLAECVIAGRTREETAEALGGASKRSVSRWKKDARVLAEVERLRTRSSEIRVDDVLLRLLESDDERVVLGAAREIYRWQVQRPPVEPEPEPVAGEGYFVVRRDPIS